MSRYIDADKIPWTDLNDNLNSNIKVLVTFAEKVNRMPTADVRENVRGEWIEVEVFPEVYDIEGIKTWGSEMQCDQCGFRHTAIEGHMTQYNFCPNCGCLMKGEKNDG